MPIHTPARRGEHRSFSQSQSFHSSTRSARQQSGRRLTYTPARLDVVYDIDAGEVIVITCDAAESWRHALPPLNQGNRRVIIPLSVEDLRRAIRAASIEKGGAR